MNFIIHLFVNTNENNLCNMDGATQETGTRHHSEAPLFISGFNGIHVYSSLIL
jgi:hypothetical protein